MTVPEEVSKGRVDEAADFIRHVTVVLGLLSVGYGALTFIFGDFLWASGEKGAYQAALSVPLAPQSWGTVAVAMGIIILWAEFAEKYKVKAIALLLQGFWCFVFASFFFYDCVDQKSAFAAPAILLWGAFGVVYIGRCRLAWKWS